MNKNITSFLLKIVAFSIVLFGVHYYILIQFFEGKLVVPLWIIYAFNAIMVFVVFSTLRFYSKDKNKNLLNIFMILTIVKMVLILILLLPLFLKKSDHLTLEVFNFFLPYFLFLSFEVFSLNKFLQKS